MENAILQRPAAPATVVSQNRMVSRQGPPIQATVPAVRKPDLTPLAELVKRNWILALDHKTRNDIRERMLMCSRQKLGQYEADIYSQIKQIGGCLQYFNITATKCNDLEAWMKDQISPTDGKPWTIRATTIPDLPEDRYQEIIEISLQQMFIDENIPFNEQSMREIVYANYDEIMAQVQHEADMIIERMSNTIEDQLIDGNFNDAIDDFLNQFVTMPTAFLKGPIVQTEKELLWQGGRVDVGDKQVLKFYAPDPKDIYPAPNVRHIDDDYICEVIRMTEKDLYAMRGMPGWDSDAIDTVLRDGVKGNPDDFQGVWERADMENRETSFNSGNSPSLLSGVEYWGDVKGEILASTNTNLGLKGGKGIEPQKHYPVVVTMFNDTVVRAVLNPNPTGKKSYFAASFERVPGSIWGNALPEKIRQAQNAYNVARRAGVNNLSFSSGPMQFLDINALDPDTDFNNLYPLKNYQFDGSRLQNSQKAVELYSVPANYGQYQAAAEDALVEADSTSGIPRFNHGDDSMDGAGATASGLSMLMSNANKGLTNVLLAIDTNVIRPVIENMYTWNMVHNPNENIKGDAQVVAKGVLGALNKERQQMALTDFLDRSSDPNDRQVIGPRLRMNAYREYLKATNSAPDDLIPDDDDMENFERQMAMASEEGMEEEVPDGDVANE